MACLIFRSLSNILFNIALWARALNLPFAHVPICMHRKMSLISALDILMQSCRF